MLRTGGKKAGRSPQERLQKVLDHRHGVLGLCRGFSHDSWARASSVGGTKGRQCRPQISLPGPGIVCPMKASRTFQKIQLMKAERNCKITWWWANVIEGDHTCTGHGSWQAWVSQYTCGTSSTCWQRPHQPQSCPVVTDSPCTGKHGYTFVSMEHLHSLSLSEWDNSVCSHFVWILTHFIVIVRCMLANLSQRIFL